MLNPKLVNALGITGAVLGAIILLTGIVYAVAIWYFLSTHGGFC